MDSDTPTDLTEIVWFGAAVVGLFGLWFLVVVVADLRTAVSRIAAAISDK